ncbi:MAG: uroporphyrinogen synthase [Rhodospirillales bacterium]|nr:uroporphyrinogen synthase [Rhodospirillales bacterium]
MSDDVGGELAGRRIVVPETRELDVLARMLERHGAAVLRCPLVSIRDAPDQAPVEAWVRRFVATPPDDLILFTGEGLGRLLAVARRIALETEFVAVLAGVRKVTRGPKPASRLRSINLKPDIPVEPATTEGIIATLSGEALADRRIGVQLYPDNPNHELFDFLAAKGAILEPVLPYVYGSESDDREVLAAIHAMAAGEIDLITFTSSPQLRRLQQVADAAGCSNTLREGLQRTRIAAVGPVVARAAEAAGGRVSIAPAENFHMKPMVSEILAAFG